MNALWQKAVNNAPYWLAVAVVLGIVVFVVAVKWLMDRQVRRSLPHTVIVRPKGHPRWVCAMWPCGNYGAAVRKKIALMRDWDRRDYTFTIEPTGGAR